MKRLEHLREVRAWLTAIHNLLKDMALLAEEWHKNARLCYAMWPLALQSSC